MNYECVFPTKTDLVRYSYSDGITVWSGIAYASSNNGTISYKKHCEGTSTITGGITSGDPTYVISPSTNVMYITKNGSCNPTITVTLTFNYFNAS